MLLHGRIWTGKRVTIWLLKQEKRNPKEGSGFAVATLQQVHDPGWLGVWPSEFADDDLMSLWVKVREPRLNQGETPSCLPFFFS